MTCGTFTTTDIPADQADAVEELYRAGTPAPTSVTRTQQPNGLYTITAVYPPCPPNTSHASGAVTPAPTAAATSTGGATTYKPSEGVLALLGTFANLIPAANPNTQAFAHPPRFLGPVPTPAGRVLVIDSALELDTDGWIGDQGNADWQAGTSLLYADGRTALDANRIPYFVLPLPTSWPIGFGIHLGDYAAVLFEGKLAFAVFGDFGPHSKIGEGSVELLRQLGQERVRPNGTVINAGTNPGVLTIVFPGSGATTDRASEATLLAAIASRGADLFTQLGGNLLA